jgi:putative hemolysin
MPSLLKSYLRLGAKVGEGAFIDKELNTIDILIIVDVLKMTKKYKVYYEKK